MLQDLALILIVAGLTTLIFKKLKQPLVLGYIVAGFLVSPHMPYTMSVANEANVEQWADIGVVFLLFSLGLEFSFKKILKMGMAPVIAACTIIFCMMTLGIVVGHSFGWGRMDCIFLGGMLAMSSTTIIYKAFDDLGLVQQKFAQMVMSVLILEDILAIVMMVMLSALAGGDSLSGGQMLMSVVKIVFFLILWFVVGIFALPSLLRRTRPLMSGETLLVVSIGLCCLMAVLSEKVGFSEAFGAFVMGSILSETVEADKIERVVEPVKNLFGAIFFVSVGMLVDPQTIADYALPILALVLTIVLGQAVFGSMGYLLSGQTLRNAMRCGFSMAQIGEFAFIIASLGTSLGVTSKFLYPVVVAVSVITTFLTPYMIRAADPCYAALSKRLPRKWSDRLDHADNGMPESATAESNWRKLFRAMAINTLIYTVLSTAVVVLMLTLALPLCRRVFGHWPGNAVCGVATIVLISPFLRSIVMKKNHSEEFKQLWTENRLNRLPLFFTILVRGAIAAAFVFYVCNYLTKFTNAFLIAIAAAAVAVMAASRGLKKQSIRLEKLFVRNLESRDIAARATGQQRPIYENTLLDHDIHIATMTVPEESKWAGKTLAQLRTRNRFGVHVSSIVRGGRRLNIPGGQTVVFPSDVIEAIGTDAQLSAMSAVMKSETYQPPTDIEQHEMRLRKFLVTADSWFCGKTLKESGIRDKYNCMVVGLASESQQENLTMVGPGRKFEAGDIVWVVGEEDNLRRLAEAGNEPQPAITKDNKQ